MMGVKAGGRGVESSTSSPSPFVMFQRAKPHSLILFQQIQSMDEMFSSKYIFLSLVYRENQVLAHECFEKVI